MSEVFFSKNKEMVGELVERVLDIDRGDVVAVKLHVGELGNRTHLGPEVAKVVVKKIREHGGEPFLTDSRTWYKGSRNNGRSHVQNALAHGFGKVGAPFKVADEKGGIEYSTNGILKTVELGALFEKANYLFAISHDKGHALAGFGGALKNLGMGCATPECKLAQHRTVGIEIDEGKCTGCGRCVEVCEYAVVREGKRRDEDGGCMRCTVCGEECPQKAIKLTDVENLQRALASVSLAVKNLFQGRWGFLSAGINITQECDCAVDSGKIIHEDVGYFSARDPVAIDAAFLEMVGAEIFERANRINPIWQVKEAEALGVGSAEHKLVPI